MGSTPPLWVLEVFKPQRLLHPWPTTFDTKKGTPFWTGPAWSCWVLPVPFQTFITSAYLLWGGPGREVALRVSTLSVHQHSSHLPSSHPRVQPSPHRLFLSLLQTKRKSRLVSKRIQSEKNVGFCIQVVRHLFKPWFFQPKATQKRPKIYKIALEKPENIRKPSNQRGQSSFSFDRGILNLIEVKHGELGFGFGQVFGCLWCS